MASSETTTTGRRARNPVSYTYPDSDDEEEVAAEESPILAAKSNDADSNDNSDDESNNNAEPRRVRPTVHGSWHWSKKPHDEFQSVDGDKIIWTSRWGSSRYMDCRASAAMERAEKSLVAKQDQHSITLDFEPRGVVTQTPYHADMLPCYEYFAEGLQQHSDIETFKIVNHHLPPSPWLGDKIIPFLEMNSNGRVYEGNMATLELSNCSLSADDLASLAKFLAGNTTLHSLDISQNNIESVDTVKALAKAIKKHPRLGHVGLAYCSLGGGNNDALDKILVACKQCVSLEIGNSDFDCEGIATVAKFLGRKNALTSFSLIGAPVVDKESKQLLTNGLAKNKTIEELCLHSNALQLPGILRNTKKITESLSRLTRLDLSFNSLPVQGAKVLAKFLAEADTSLTSLVMTNNHLTVKGANILLPALKENTSLQHLDLSRNWLNDKAAPAIIDALKNNSTLLSLDLSGNKSLKASHGGGRSWRNNWERNPKVEGGRPKVVKGALFDTTSLEAIGNSNHTCAVTMAGNNRGSTYEDTIFKINTLDVCEGKKIRYKVVLALNEVNKDLFDTRSFDDVPLELMPHLLEMVQQEVKYSKHHIELKSKMRKHSLGRLYEIIAGWPSLPLLFVRGAGKLKRKKRSQPKKKTKRRKFGEEDDDDDEAFIPKGARTTARWMRDPETGRWKCIPAPVY